MPSSSSSTAAPTPYRPSPTNGRRRGLVKWFSDAKGYGFISPADNAKDLFVHFSGINGKGHRQLQEGQEVEFDVENGEKGLFATRVDVIAPPAT